MEILLHEAMFVKKGNKIKHVRLSRLHIIIKVSEGGKISTSLEIGKYWDLGAMVASGF